MKKYRIFNSSKQTLLASEAELADTSWTRMRGLLGRAAEEFRFGKGLWIVPSQGVHTIGMKYPIDVAYLDSESRVIRTYHNLSPFRLTAIKLKTESVVELPAGVLRQSQTSVGDILEISRIEIEGG